MRFEKQFFHHQGPTSRLLEIGSPLLILVGAALLLGTLGCGNGEQPKAETDTTAIQTYTVRALVSDLPGSGEPGTQLLVHHEAIPDFLAAHGKIMAMDSMTMPFHLGPDVSAAELQPGDRISFELEIDWSRDPADRITAIELLSPDTVLAFELDEAEEVHEHGE